MAEAVGLASGIIAIVNLSAKLAGICYQYSAEVGGARKEIQRLQTQVTALGTTLQEAHHLIESPKGRELAASRQLDESLDGSRSQLEELQVRLDPGKARKAMRRFGLRALKWPFTAKETEAYITNLRQHEQTVILALQLDQTKILLDIRQKMENVTISTAEDARTDQTCFMVPFDRDPNFVDRPEIIDWMNKERASHTSRIALVGMGGFGKSQIAIQFAHLIRESPGQKPSIFWVHGGTRAKFSETYRAIADRLNIPRRDDPTENLLALVRDWLQRDDVGPWVMVLDNADDVGLFFPSSTTSKDQANKQNLAPYLPKRQNSMIVVTSRSLDAAEKLTGGHRNVRRISTMTQDQAMQLWRNRIESSEDEQKVHELLGALDCIPLAVSQAASYIARRAPRVSVQSYLDDFRKSDQKKGSLLNVDAGDLRRDETVSNSVVLTWQTTFEQIRGERLSAAHLLCFMSFFSPQDIPESVLHDYLRETSDASLEDSFEEDLDILRSYSLVSLTATGDTCDMHPLVQFCTQLWMASFGDLPKWRSQFLYVMYRHFPSGEFSTWAACRKLFPHIQIALANKPDDEEDLKWWASFTTNAGHYLNTTGSYREATRLLERSLEVKMDMYGEENPLTLNTMGLLSSLYRTVARWEEGETMAKRVLKLRTRIFGEKDIATLDSMMELASAYQQKLRWDEAEQLQLKVLDISVAGAGQNDLRTATCKAELALIYYAQGRIKEAEEFEVSVVKLRSEQLGDEHPDTLTSMNNLASTFWVQKRYEEAADLQRTVMKVRTKVLGKEHPDTLTVIGNLASTYWMQNRFTEAAELQESVLRVRSNIFAREHPENLRVMSDLASTYWKQKRYQEAAELQEAVLELRPKVLGEEHPDTWTAMTNLASTYWHQGRYDECRVVEERRLAAYLGALGEDDPSTLLSMRSLADTLRKLGLNKEALSLGRRAVEVYKRHEGEPAYEEFVDIEKEVAKLERLAAEREHVTTEPG